MMRVRVVFLPTCKLRLFWVSELGTVRVNAKPLDSQKRICVGTPHQVLTVRGKLQTDGDVCVCVPYCC